MKSENIFLSGDWGTTRFRLRLVQADTLLVQAERQTDEGIAAVYADWQRQGADPAGRLAFYRRILASHIRDLERGNGRPLGGVPVVLSGMASSSLGMAELPYLSVPFAATNLIVSRFAEDSDFPNPLLVISGARTATDVMRGEETQLAGCLADEPPVGRRLFVLPGTHAKHAVVQKGQVTDFRTFMTGEIFSLLTKHSVLAVSVQPNADFETYRAAFLQGVQDGYCNPLLNALFRVRTRQLFGECPPPENHHYLSGLLVGAELAAVRPGDFDAITLLADGIQRQVYEAAFRTLFDAPPTVRSADEALLRGQKEIWNAFKGSEAWHQ
ncbi:MAG: 2-dehydro-3-deoxygalactonokinase [Cytophagales bacterium]|jgi:2-dehydro-3-deoxygalactonokinase|nr:2-dehydro-3-deoxygalactonokinase [Cytophagales bacterium]